MTERHSPEDIARSNLLMDNTRKLVLGRMDLIQSDNLLTMHLFTQSGVADNPSMRDALVTKIRETIDPFIQMARDAVLALPEVHGSIPAEGVPSLAVARLCVKGLQASGCPDDQIEVLVTELIEQVKDMPPPDRHTPGPFGV